MFNYTKEELIKLYTIWGYELKNENNTLAQHNYYDTENEYLEKIIGRWARTLTFLDKNTIKCNMYLIDGEYKGKNSSNEWCFTANYKYKG